MWPGRDRALEQDYYEILGVGREASDTEIKKSYKRLAVQYHPEASPGPHDATYLFDCFAVMMATGRAPTGEEMADAQAALQRRQCTGLPR